MQDDALQRFLAALQTADDSGRPTNIYTIGYDGDEPVVCVFARGKAQFLVMGEAKAAWITPAGRRAMAQRATQTSQSA